MSTVRFYIRSVALVPIQKAGKPPSLSFLQKSKLNRSSTSSQLYLFFKSYWEETKKHPETSKNPCFKLKLPESRTPKTRQTNGSVQQQLPKAKPGSCFHRRQFQIPPQLLIHAALTLSFFSFFAGFFRPAKKRREIQKGGAPKLNEP